LDGGTMHKKLYHRHLIDFQKTRLYQEALFEECFGLNYRQERELVHS